MSKFISYAIRLFFMALFIILYLQELAVSETECEDLSSTIPGYYERCNPDWKPHWSPTNSQEITPGGSAVVTFEGGQLPYTWQISGDGYWLDEQRTLTSGVTDTISATIYADENACGAAQITVTDYCEAQSSGELRSDIAQLEWDDNNSPETMDPGESVTIAVTGGQPPYQWTFDETYSSGFSLSNSETSDVTNTLNTNASACGAVRITVTDACNEQIVGVVRSTVGGWANCTGGSRGGSACDCPPPGTWSTSPALPWEIYLNAMVRIQLQVCNVVCCTETVYGSPCLEGGPISCGGFSWCYNPCPDLTALSTGQVYNYQYYRCTP